jgi:Uma2 family endonuclease
VRVRTSALQYEGDLRDLADRLLETTRVEYVEEGVLIVMTPPGFQHGAIVADLVRSFNRAETEWSVRSENFQWDLPDASRRFFVPDLVVSHPGAASNEEERAGIVLVAEVTSPDSEDTVLNDRTIKPKHYARGGVPLYLLVDQERSAWTLYALADGWQRYQVAADGRYGEPVPLPEPFRFALPTGGWPHWTPGKQD